MNKQRLLALVCGAVVASFAATAFAQPAPKAPATPVQQPPQQMAPPEPQWDSFPTMLLEKIYRGPLKDTVIQRWRDPVDGTVCYIYLPISVPLLPGAQGYAQYGGSGIGNISCIHQSQVVQMIQQVPQAPGKH